jgi:hypothetical protein
LGQNQGAIKGKKMANENVSAFPVYTGEGLCDWVDGMTLRDYFAAAALRDFAPISSSRRSPRRYWR